MKAATGGASDIREPRNPDCPDCSRHFRNKDLVDADFFFTTGIPFRGKAWSGEVWRCPNCRRRNKRDGGTAGLALFAHPMGVRASDGRLVWQALTDDRLSAVKRCRLGASHRACSGVANCRTCGHVSYHLIGSGHCQHCEGDGCPKKRRR